MTAVLSLVAVSGCNWVDSKGVQPGEVTEQGLTVRLSETEQKSIDFSETLTIQNDTVDSSNYTLLQQGPLSECTNHIDLSVAATNLDAACAMTEDCELLFFENNNGPAGSHNTTYTLSAPVLRYPIGMQYSWSFGFSSGQVQDTELTVCLSAENSAPVARADSYVLNAGETLVISGAVFNNRCEVGNNDRSMLANDIDDNHHGSSDCLTAELLTLPTQAVNDFAGSFIQTGGFRYSASPAPDEPVDSFTYRVSDGNTYSSAATVRLVVLSDETAPVARNDEYELRRNTSDNQLRVISNDTDPLNGTLTITEVTTPNRGGSVTIEDSFLYYTPRRTFRGTETFRYTLENEFGQSDNARVTIVVTR